MVIIQYLIFFLIFHFSAAHKLKMSKRPKRPIECWVVEGRAPVSSGLGGWAAWRSVNVRLAERQMATNMLSRLGKH